MTAPRALAALVLVLALVVPALALAPAARAEDAAPPAPAPATEPPSPAPAMEGAAAGTSEAGGKDSSRSMKALEEELERKPAVAVALVLFKYGLIVAAIVLVVLARSRRADVRRGLLPAPPPVPAPVVPVALPYALAIVIGAFALVEAGGTVLRNVLPADLRSKSVLGILAMAVPSVAAAALVLRLRAQARAEAGRPAPPAGPSVRAGLWTFVVGSGVAVVVALAAAIVLRLAGEEAVAQDPVVDAIKGPPWEAWLITFYGVLVAPFAEEALFRGLLHPAARPFLGGWGATAGVAFLFALVHNNLYGFFPLLTLGLFLGWLLERTDSLLATFTVHALFNASNLLPILLFRYT